MKIVKIVLATTSRKRWYVYQMGICNAFLNGDLTDEIYIDSPQGFASQGENKVCRLVKFLCVLKQAPRQ